MKHLLPLAFLLFTSILFGQSGYHIEVSIEGYTEDTLLLGHHYGNQQYLKDTAYRDDRGHFVFAGEEELEGGVYLIVLKPKNDFIQVLINPGEQQMKLEAMVGDQVPRLSAIEGSEDNQIFNEYLTFIQSQSPKAQALREQIQKAEQDADAAKKSELSEALESINTDVKNRQQQLIDSHPNSLTATLIKGTLQPQIPSFQGDPKEVEMQRYLYYKKHYFDEIDFQDTRLVRTPFLFQKISTYMNDLVPKVPDSINAELDGLFAKMDGNEELFKYYLIHFLNFYAKSEFVGMDAMYVHLVDNYYAKGKAEWLDKEQLAKITENADRLRPLLIGKEAPNLALRDKDQNVISLHDIKSEYTILFFWDPDCGHCKKSMPDMIQFYEDHKDEDISIVAVCSKLNTSKEPQAGNKCWEYIEKDNPEMQAWTNLNDPFHLSRYKIIYDLKSTPQIFVLDKNKTIRSKRIGANQLNEVMIQLRKEDELINNTDHTGGDH